MMLEGNNALAHPQYSPSLPAWCPHWVSKSQSINNRLSARSVFRIPAKQWGSGARCAPARARESSEIRTAPKSVPGRSAVSAPRAHLVLHVRSLYLPIRGRCSADRDCQQYCHCCDDDESEQYGFGRVRQHEQQLRYDHSCEQSQSCRG